MIDYSSLPIHMRGAMQLYIERGINPGSFLTAVLENDLMKAAERADEINKYAFFEYCVFLYNEAPTACYGSPEAVASWKGLRNEVA